MVIFKLIPKTIVAAFIVVIFPAGVFAISGTDSGEAKTPGTSEKVQSRTQATPVTDEKVSEQKQLLKCQAIGTVATKIKEQQSQRNAEIEVKRNKVQENTTERQSEREQTLLAKRAEWDTRRQENFTKLRAKATTDIQKDAVEVYVKTVTTAIAKHRSSNDAAFAEFRTGMSTVKAGVSQSVKENMTKNTTQVDVAITTAKAACTSGQSADSVKQSLRTQLQAVRSESKQERQSINISQEMKEIVQKRKDAVEASAAVFKATTQKARETLLIAFKDTTKIVE